MHNFVSIRETIGGIILFWKSDVPSNDSKTLVFNSHPISIDLLLR